MHDYAALASILMDIEAHLRQLNQWHTDVPSSADLSSTQPFCVDTLSFSQWVQFIFIPKLTVLIDQQAPLPLKSEISPMVEEFCKAEGIDRRDLLLSFQQLDKLLTT